ncbi:MAG: hypothetical protein HGA72_08740 [Chlorobiaceae bacterium]|nr:hypothetical protein [Chlorobiaceae bacterium]
MIEVSETIIAAISASIVTFIGVLYTVRKSYAHLRFQLEHDAKERERERQMSLRRHVYLPAIGVFSSNLSSIVNMANLELLNEQLFKINEDTPAIAQIQIVGSDTVVLATNHYSLVLTEALMTLIGERVKLLDLKHSFELAIEYENKSLANQREYIDMMTNYKLQGSADQSLLNRIEVQIKFYGEQTQKYGNEREKAFSILNKQHIAFLGICLDHLIKVSELIPPIVIAIREELELPLDRETFLYDHRKSMERMKNIIGDAVSKYETQGRS